VERVTDVAAGIISARAVASLDNLFTAAQHCAGGQTRWLLPKGRSVQADLAEARQRWSLMFHVEQSVVDPDSSIVVLDRVARR
jgi:16S rRNA (guanine527-N7)-methyltransferase